jgi:hypothetical protein
MERAYLGRPDSESGEFYVQNVRREIPTPSLTRNVTIFEKSSGTDF